MGTNLSETMSESQVSQYPSRPRKHYTQRKYFIRKNRESDSLLKIGLLIQEALNISKDAIVVANPKINGFWLRIKKKL